MPSNPQVVATPGMDVPTFFITYCGACHGADEPMAGLQLDPLPPMIAVAADRHTWETVLEKLRLGQMPPEGELQPDEDQRKKLADWISAELRKAGAEPLSHPGRVTIRRLNRTEYNNTIRDLVGVDFQPAEDFPADDVGHGFDNLGEVLSLSPMLMEKYLAAAQQVVRAAMDDDQVRERIIFCWPSPAQSRDQCAREVLARFATRAFRHPVEEGELQRLMQLVHLAASQGADYQQSLELALQAILASPSYLFRAEPDEAARGSDQVQPLGAYQLATRLSYFLWSSMPDDELFSLAEKGQLNDDAVLQRQVQRMLRDAKSRAMVDSFAAQWLELRKLESLAPDPDRFPDFDTELRNAMLGETKQFFEVVMREDRSILEFLDCDYTFVNARLARHYGITGIDSDQLQRVHLPDGRRGGVLTQASILTLTSNPTRTSPVKRGKWILDNILGAPPPPPPAGVPELVDGEQAELLGSLRERMEQHRENPTCAVCHRSMDPLGFGLENFDAIGAWRQTDGRFPIEAGGELPGSRHFRGPQELRDPPSDRKRTIHSLPGPEDVDVCSRPRVAAARPRRRGPDRGRGATA